MEATQRPIPGTFSKVPGGYEQKIGENMSLFVPDMCAASFDETTGQLQGYAPDYEALEAAKSPAVHADAPGEYSYCYEMQHAPTGCDFSADLGYYGITTCAPSTTASPGSAAAGSPMTSSTTPTPSRSGPTTS